MELWILYCFVLCNGDTMLLGNIDEIDMCGHFQDLIQVICMIPYMCSEHVVQSCISLRAIIR
jgi:hypothetical protein